MSTKLHHGYRLHASTHADVFAALADFRGRAYPWYEQQFAKSFSHAVALAHDRVAYGAHPPGEPAEADPNDVLGGPYITTRIRFDDQYDEMRAKHRRAPGVDYECEITVMPDTEDPAVLYALVFSEHGAYHGMWADTPGVEPYPYWNTSDRPEDVDEAEWDRRRETWDRVLGWDAPARRGLTFTLVGEMLAYPSLDEVVAGQPSPQERAKALSFDLAAHELIAEDREAGNDTKLMSLLFSDRLKERALVIAEGLVPSITPLTRDALTERTRPNVVASGETRRV